MCLDTYGQTQEAQTPEAQPADPAAQNTPEADATQFLQNMEKRMTELSKQVSRSVVAIARVRRDTEPRNETLRFPLGPGARLDELNRPTDPDFIPTEYATGVIIDNEGFIITCFSSLSDPRNSDYYVWSGKEPKSAEPVWISAEVQAGDPFSDLAILKIPPTPDITPIVMSEEETTRKGQLVFAFGNPYAVARDGSPSMAWGIVSNVDRALAGTPGRTALPQEKETLHHFGGLLQIDGNLSNGFSGGPVLNLDGKMVGLIIPDAALPDSPRHGGFAIPVDSTFKRVIESLKKGRIPEFGFLGIVPEEIPFRSREPGIKGAYVSRVVPGLPGDLAGLRGEDIITAVNDKPVFDRNSLFYELSRMGAEEEVQLSVLRPNRFGGFPEAVTLKGKLSKKYIASVIPPYTIKPPPNWRGLAVEYSTALPTEMLRFMSRAIPTTPKLAALQVEPNTAAWQAGIRPGQLILAVQGENVESPDQFTELVNRFNDRPVEITVIDTADTLRKVTVR